MGLECDCEARLDGRWRAGHARLEEKELFFRGDLSLRAPFDRLSDVHADGGLLAFRFDGRDVALRLGAQAEKWAARIVNPRSRLDKLGVKPGMVVSVLGLEADAAFMDELRSREARVHAGRAAPQSDLVFFLCKDRLALTRLEALARAIRPEGAIWVVWPKGGPGMREQDVRDAGEGPGLVDVKVVSFSDTLSGLKMMIRRERRPAAPARPTVKAARTARRPARSTGARKEK
jgi:hypothetical protein